MAGLENKRKTQSPPQAGNTMALPQGWLRFESGKLNSLEVLRNLEKATSLLQTAQNGVRQADEIIADVIVVMQSAWLSGDRSGPPMKEMGRYLALKKDQLAQLANTCRFHGRGLLDGQSGVVGTGQGVMFVRAGGETKASPEEGWKVEFTAQPTRGFMLGGVPLHRDWIAVESEILVVEGERTARFVPERGMDEAAFITGLAEALNQAGLNLEVGLTRQRRLYLRHAQYGAHPRFKGISRETPLLSRKPGRLESNHRGRDVAGTIGGEAAFGVGRVLMGYLDNPNTAELAVAWRGESKGPLAVHVRQNSLVFPEGPGGRSGLGRVVLPDLRPTHLGNWVDTLGGLQGLEEAQVETWAQVLDLLYMLYAIQGELNEWKERMGIWIERCQNRALAMLRHNEMPQETLEDQKTENRERPKGHPPGFMQGEGEWGGPQKAHGQLPEDMAERLKRLMADRSA